MAEAVCSVIAAGTSEMANALCLVSMYNQGNPPSSLSSELSDGQLCRTNSLPSVMNTIEGPVQLRLHGPHSNRNAQNWMAISNSDYQNQWRSQLAPVHGSGAIAAGPCAPTLDTISEYEMRGVGGGYQYGPPLDMRSQGVADPNMFQYAPTPAMNPLSYQQVPTPFSHPTTPQIGSAGFTRPTSLVLASPPPSASVPAVANTSFLGNSPQPIHVSAAAADQFLPLFLNPEKGGVYMFKDRCFVPMPAKNVQRATSVTKPPTPDRSMSRSTSSPPRKQVRDHLKLVLGLMLVSCMFLNLPVLVLFLLPALFCSLQARHENAYRRLEKARACAEWAVCSSVTATIVIVLTILVIPITILTLHFAVGTF